MKQFLPYIGSCLIQTFDNGKLINAADFQRKVHASSDSEANQKFRELVRVEVERIESNGNQTYVDFLKVDRDTNND